MNHGYSTIFDFCTCSREIIDIFFCLKKIEVDFSLDSFKVGSFKLCMTLLVVYISIVGLMTLTLFHGQRYVRNINCKLCFLDSCLDSWLLYFQCYVVAIYMKKIMHNMNCATLVCVQGR